MSIEAFNPKFIQGEPKVLHLMPNGENQCSRCGASKFAMRTYFTTHGQTWIDVASFGQHALIAQESVFLFKACKV